MPRFAPRLSVLLLAATALCGCGMMGDLTGMSPKEAAVREKPPTPKAVASDMDGNLRQAQLLRLAGSNDEAIHILSQLMLADADNPRVVAEYGKTLAQKGRAQDATQFLRRAIELAPGDWTLYSALGVSYDQLGDQINARLAYDHALALKPGEASVLNNYALSRMMAKDPENARLLIAQAQAASGAVADAKIARNVALITGMVPEKAAEAEKPTAIASAVKNTLASARPAPAPMKLPEPQIVAAVPQPPIPVTPLPLPAPRTPMASGSPQNANDVSRLLASQNPIGNANAAPRALVPQMAAMQPAARSSGVVMQAVPYDPYAGAVAAKPRPKAVAKAAPGSEPGEARPQQTAARANVVPSLRVATDKY